jgi:hypothetical protein
MSWCIFALQKTPDAISNEMTREHELGKDILEPRQCDPKAGSSDK